MALRISCLTDASRKRVYRIQSKRQVGENVGAADFKTPKPHGASATFGGWGEGWE